MIKFDMDAYDYETIKDAQELFWSTKSQQHADS